MISDVEVREAGEKGRGVFALRAFTRGEFIFRRRNGPSWTLRAWRDCQPRIRCT